MTIEGLLSLPVFERVGWTLLHSLWQLSLLGVLVAAGLLTLRRASANARYALALGALLAMAAWPAITFVLLGSDAVSPAESRPSPSPSPAAVAEGAPVAQPPSATAAAGPSEYEARLAGARRPPRAGIGLRALLEPVAPYCAVFWFVGVIILSARLEGGWLRLEGLRARAALAEPDWSLRFASLAGRLCVTRPVRLLAAAIEGSPVVVGWLRPAVLVPPAAFLNLSTDQLEAILLHELAHVRRFDYLANAVQTAIETCLFYHPAAWWLSRRIRVEREHCADDLAARATGDALLYANALTRLAETSPHAARLAPAARCGALFERIQRLLGGPRGRVHRHRLFSALLAPLVVSLTAALLLPAVFAQKEGPKEAGGLTLEFETQADFAVDRATLTLWRALKDGEQLPRAASLDDWAVGPWHDDKSGRTYVPAGHYGGTPKHRVENLDKGSYLVTAALETTGNGIPKIVAARKDFVLDGSQELTRVVLAAADSPGIALYVTDAASGEPLHARVMLFAEDGLPIGDGSHGFVSYTDDHGRLEFAGLAPGKYHLKVGRSARHYGDTEYATVESDILVALSGAPVAATAPLSPVQLAQAEIDKRWPFVVEGTVTDGDGNPMPGVTVTAHAGMGTLFPVGSAASAKDGTYELRFGPGVHFLNEKTGQWEIGTQPAIIRPEKEGFYEASLNSRGGNIVLAGSEPLEGDRADASREIIYANKPHTLDFVMARAARVTVSLHGPSDKPIADQPVEVHRPELPRERDQIAGGKTGADGTFTFDAPLGLCRFEIGDVKSNIVRLERAVEYEVSLTYNEAEKWLMCGVAEKVSIEVRGTVITWDGRPLPPSTTVCVEGRYPNGGASTNPRLGPDGRFFASMGLSDEGGKGEVHLTISAPGYAPFFLGPIESDVKDLTFVLQAGFTARVKLADESGNPISGAVLEGRYADDTGKLRAYGDWVTIGDVVTDADGVATIEHCGDKPLTLVAYVPGYQGDTRVFALNASDVPVWTLRKSRPASGVVLSKADGKPIAGAELMLYRAGGAEHVEFATMRRPGRRPTTDEAGRFTITTLRDDGSYGFQVDAKGYENAILEDVRAGTADLEVRLGPEIYVRGKFVGPLEVLGGLKELDYWPQPQPDAIGARFGARVDLDVRDGAAYFEIRRLWPGTLTLSLPGKDISIDVTKAIDGLTIDLSDYTVTVPSAEEKGPENERGAQAARETQWGDAVAGVRVRVRFDKAARQAWETPYFYADVRNDGAREMTVSPTQATSEVEVDGEWYECIAWHHKFPSPLSPGGEYNGIIVTLNDYYRRKPDGAPLVMAPGSHVVRVACIPEYGEPGKPIPVRAVSPPFEIKIVAAPSAAAPKDTWGRAIDGVACRLRPEKPTWNPGETPLLRADLRNGGSQDLFAIFSEETRKLEVDGRQYDWAGPVEGGWPQRPFPPGEEILGLEIQLSGEWIDEAKQPLTLKPGNHTIRVPFYCQPVKEDAGKRFRVVSDPVQIEILPEAAAGGDAKGKSGPS